jgi:hypothetical protein
MAINFYLTYKDSMLLENVLKTELAKEVDEYTLNRIINNDYINFINNVGKSILANGGDYAEYCSEDSYLTIRCTGKNCYTFMVERIRSKNDVKKTMVFEKVGIQLNSNYQFHQITSKELLVLEPEDWSEEEWKTILKIFNVEAADTISVSIKDIRIFGALKGE